jgi:hypothetical protein
MAVNTINIMYRFATTAVMLTCSTIRAGAADELVKKGDDCDLKLQASEALDFYLAAENLEPESASLLLRIARQYRHLMVDATNSLSHVKCPKVGVLPRIADEHLVRFSTTYVSYCARSTS